MTASAVIHADGVCVRYGETLALDRVDLRVDPGAVHGLIGMNGSGKSSLFKALMGLVALDAGTIRLFDADPAAARRAGRVSYTPQSEDVDWAFPVSVSDVVLMGRYGHMGWRRKAGPDDRCAVDAALERGELAALRDRQIGELSGGQKKRAFVARALAQGAELLFLDEPFAGVDKRSEKTITDVLRELAAAGRTIVVSTHDLIAVPGLCDRVTLINRRIVDTGAPDAMLVPERLAEAFGGFVPQEALARHRRAEVPA